MSPRSGEPLAALARALGVQVRWTANDGRRHRVPPESLCGVLRALGVDLAGPADAPAALAALEADRRAALLPPLLAGRVHPGGGTGPVVPLHTEALPAKATVTVVLEDGETRSAPAPALLRPGPAGAAADPGRARLDLARLGPLPPGYHRLVLEGPGLTAQATLVLAPRRLAPPARRWAVFAPLHALRQDPDSGLGRYPDLADLARSAQESAGTAEPPLVATLPLLAGLLDGEDADPSPYRPASRLALAEHYVAPWALDELAASPEARATLAGLAEERRRLAAADDADHQAAWAATRAVLEPLAADLLHGRLGPGRLAAFGRWLGSRPLVVAYAWYRALRAAGRHRQGADAGLQTLPPGLRAALAPAAALPDPGQPAGLEPGAVGEVLALARQVPAFGLALYAQWAAERQLAAVAEDQDLLADLPVGVHPGGFDPWWLPHAFVTGASCGAPPDAFFASGQDWGLAPLHPLHWPSAGSRYLAASMRTALRFARVLRIDHVMGLHRLWLVPPGGSAVDGCYVRYPAAELRAVAVLEASRAGAAVVGEDLGTVPRRVRQAMGTDGMLRTWVWQFAARPDDPLPAVPEDALASLGTHDTPPFAAFLEEPGEERAALRARLGGDLDAALGRCLEHLGSSPARLAQVDLADLLLERRPQNRPGIAAGSFRLRHPAPPRTLLADPRARRLLGQLAATRQGGTR